MTNYSISGSKKRTHLVLAFLVSILTLNKQCQASPAFHMRNNHAPTAFTTPSKSIIHSRTHIGRLQRRDFISMQPTMTSLPMMSFLDTSTSSLIATTLDSTIQQQQQQMDEAPIIIEQLSPTTTLIVFIIGIIPFIWATIEFWRRIAVGASFGTGSDSVVIPSPFDNTDNDDGLITIGEDGNPLSSRGRQTLDRGALTVAYVLFGVAAFSVGIAVASVVMGPKPDVMI